MLLSADIGEGLFFAGPAHAAMRVIASPEEHTLVTTKPQELEEKKTVASPAQTPPPDQPPLPQPSQPAQPATSTPSYPPGTTWRPASSPPQPQTVNRPIFTVESV